MSEGNRRIFLKTSAAALGGAVLLPTLAHTAEVPQGMDAITAIATRRSVRSFTNKPVSEAQVTTLLRAGMAAPSARNQQPWEFVVIRDKKILSEIVSINKHATFARDASVSILTCMNSEYEKAPGYGIQDVSACTQNILIAAHAMGLGAVWTGVYPQKERVEGCRILLNISKKVIPLALVLIGHPAATPPPEDRYNEERIHKDMW